MHAPHAVCRRLAAGRVVPTAATLALMVTLLPALGGCNRGQERSVETSAAESRPADSAGEGRSTERRTDRRGDERPRGAQVLPIDDSKYLEIGYRRDWTGFPSVPGEHRVADAQLFGAQLFVRASDSTVSALDTDTGRMRWASTLSTSLTRFAGMAPATLPDGRDTVLVASEAEIYFVDPNTGNILDIQRLERVVSTGPLVFGSTAVFGTLSGEMLAHNFRFGAKFWGHQLPGSIEYGPTRVGDDIVAGVSAQGGIAFLDPATGRLYGQAKIFQGVSTEPVSDNGLLFIASLDQAIYAFNPVGGSRVWRVPTPHPLRVQPTAHDGVLYVETREDGIIAFDQQTGQRLWANAEARGTVVGMRNNKLLSFDGSHIHVLYPRTGAVERSIRAEGVGRVFTDEFVDGNLYLVGSRGGVARFVPRG
ncbi:MAG: PQQ-binding-like beta-propeller repeat protein [Phycisphaerales bacterium]|nr:PQQ-binding-like beta-propeller repeat protein [Phycisphaerales bacterium]